MRKHKARRFSYTAINAEGKPVFWHVFADTEEEAEKTARWICMFFGAEYLGNMVGGQKCNL